MSIATPQAQPKSHRREPEPAAPSANDITYRHDAAHYVAAMLAELRQIAGKAGLDKLVTTFDAAHYDASAAMDLHNTPAVAEAGEKLS